MAVIDPTGMKAPDVDTIDLIPMDQQTHDNIWTLLDIVDDYINFDSLPPNRRNDMWNRLAIWMNT